MHLAAAGACVDGAEIRRCNMMLKFKVPCIRRSVTHAARPHSSPDPPHARAHPRHGRRNGHADPAVQAVGGRLSRRVPRSLARPEGRQRSPVAHATRGRAQDPRRVPRGGRGHHRDQHVQRDFDRAGRLRHASAGVRDQPRGRQDRARVRRRVDRAHAGQAALRRRRDGTDQPHGVDLARRQRPGRAQRERSTSSWRPTPRRSRACAKAAPTSCWSRRSSTR